VDAEHNVGPMEQLDLLTTRIDPGTGYVFWENRGRPEYETPYDPPAPDVPIRGTLTLTKYAVAFEFATQNNEEIVSFKNKLADIEGKVELYDAKVRTDSLFGAGSHAMAVTERTLPAGLVEWRLRITGNLTETPEDVYVLNCANKDDICRIAGRQETSAAANVLVVDKPSAGKWKIVVRSRDAVEHPQPLTICEALLTPATQPIEGTEKRYARGASWTLPLPRKQGDAKYVAFRFAGGDLEKDGPVIAMTPLDSKAP